LTGNKKTIKLKCIKPILESIDFKGVGVQTIQDVGTEPEWKKANVNGTGARNEPFCVIRNKNFDVDFVFSLPTDLTFETTFGAICSIPSDDAGISISRSFTVKDKNKNFNAKFTLTEKDEVGKDTSRFKWSIVKQNNNNNNNNSNSNNTVFSDTSHIKYITWDSYKCPQTDFTKGHIDYACTTANGATTLAGIGDKLGPPIMGQEFFWPKNPNNWISSDDAGRAWEIVDTKSRNNPLKGDCGLLAILMKKAIELLGDDTAKVGYVYARTTEWKGLVLNAPKTSHGYYTIEKNTFTLVYYSGGLNKYEGCCTFQNKWWMGGLGKSAESALDVLNTVTQNNKNENAVNDNGQRQCWRTNHTISVPYPPGVPTAQQQTIP
jgi:hypothetical protein